ncbi:MAG: urease accessory protein UreD [Acidimicrobiales bacterium]
MRAHARLSVSVGPWGTRFDEISSAAPLFLRPCADDIYLVGSAASPLGGDVVEMAVEVGAGATLTVKSVAAALARRGPHGMPSTFSTDIRVAEDASLYWLPEPGIACSGCDHRTRARITLERGAKLWWREEIVLGRYGESSGAWDSLLEVDYCARPLIRHKLSIGQPGWDGPAVTAGYRVLGSLVVAGDTGYTGGAKYVGEDSYCKEAALGRLAYGNSDAMGRGNDAMSSGPSATSTANGGTSAMGALLPLEGPGVLLSTIAPDLPSLRRMMNDLGSDLPAL